MIALLLAGTKDDKVPFGKVTGYGVPLPSLKIVLSIIGLRLGPTLQLLGYC